MSLGKARSRRLAVARYGAKMKVNGLRYLNTIPLLSAKNCLNVPMLLSTSSLCPKRNGGIICSEARCIADAVITPCRSEMILYSIAAMRRLPESFLAMG